MSQDAIDPSRRAWVGIACGAGAIGGVATAIPFVSSFAPSERAKAAGAAVEVDVSTLNPGEMATVEWRGKPVWILKRTPEQVESLNKTDAKVADPQSKRKPDELTPEYARNQYRSRKPELLVAVGICSHLGCSPTAKLQGGAQPGLPDDWQGGFFCPCHGSMFDLAGRVYKNVPAPDNLEIPPYVFLSDSKVLIGEDKKA
ncbi:MAG: ubiquinol-cytochrome c reductase iron-sulfur subunit [Aquincola sp.]|nr:ubiquinol-cytochrome c reductase iron-sulfur subunit [Aquincola sp.]